VEPVLLECVKRRGGGLDGCWGAIHGRGVRALIRFRFEGQPELVLTLSPGGPPAAGAQSR